jgi:hypothetical protein
LAGPLSLGCTIWLGGAIVLGGIVVGEYQMKLRDIREFCTELDREKQREWVDRESTRMGFRRLPFTAEDGSGDGVLLASKPSVFPFTSFYCDVRYQGDRVARSVFFFD